MSDWFPPRSSDRPRFGKGWQLPLRGRRNTVKVNHGLQSLEQSFGVAASQLSDKSHMVRLAGVFAMAALADAWPERRQACLNMLCSYLRFPYIDNTASDLDFVDSREFAKDQQVRQAVISVIAAHLRPDDQRLPTLKDWRYNTLDFTGVIFDGGDFTGAEFRDVDFSKAWFRSGTICFRDVKFCGKGDFRPKPTFSWLDMNITNEIFFRDAIFSGAEVVFDSAVIEPDCRLDFSRALFNGGSIYLNARFEGRVIINAARFSGSNIYFGPRNDGVSRGQAQFKYGYFEISDATFAAGVIDFCLSMRSKSCDVGLYGAFQGTTIDYTNMGGDLPMPYFHASQLENALVKGYIKRQQPPARVNKQYNPKSLGRESDEEDEEDEEE